MLEHYFLKPETIDRIRQSWIGVPIEKYVDWLESRDYTALNIRARVPVVRQFGEFARAHGAQSFEDLPSQLDPFLQYWLSKGDVQRSTNRIRQLSNEIRGLIEQMLRLILPDFVGRGRTRVKPTTPFCNQAPKFFDSLREERGIQETTIQRYEQFLRSLENYMTTIGMARVDELSIPVISAFITDSCGSMSKSHISGICSSLRVFLRYVHREGIIDRDLSSSIEGPKKYRLSKIPRSISWDEVRKMLEVIDRRTAVGKRDYVIVLLLVTYGLRGCEVASLTLDDIDWRRERLLVPERKAGHCTAYPLSTVVGDALLDYIQNARPETANRQIFLRALAPRSPLTNHAVGCRATYYLRKAGIDVRRPGSHTLRHTCVQRLIDAEFPLKIIGDYVGHRSPSSTEIYSKVDIESLREVALGDGEDLL
jgi:integrase/recombinase XerD